MGLFANPLSYAGYPPGVTGTPTTQNTTVRAATAAESAAGTKTDCYVSPATATSATDLDFASPPALGFGSTTKRPVHATTLESTGSSTIGTTGATVNTFGSSNASSTSTFTAGAAVLGLTNLGGTYPGHLNQTAPAAGFIGERIRSAVAVGSAVALVSTTPADVTSISLTPGVWDVNGVVSFTGTLQTLNVGSINSTSATLGTDGDNAVGSALSATAAGPCSIVIPTYRVLVTATAPEYLIAASTFTGSANAYGRISATRVA